MTVLVAGSYNLDQLYQTDRLPGPGETRLGRYHRAHGGKGFNQAVAASRAGAAVRFLGAVGDDDAGAGVRAFAGQEGLAAIWKVSPSHPTGVAAVISDATGENQIVVAPGANLDLTAADLEPELSALQTGDVFLAQLESPIPTVLAGLTAARRQGALAVLNPAPAPTESAPALLRSADLVTPNETEFAALYANTTGRELPSDWVDAADAQLHRWCAELEVPLIVITLGAQGGFCSVAEPIVTGSAKGHHRYIAPSVTPVDTTGAGDAFNGNLAASLSLGLPLPAAIDRAAAAAALAVTTAGATPAMPRAAAVDRFVESAGR